MNASAAGSHGLTLANGSTTGVLFLMGAQDAAPPGGQSRSAPPQGREEVKREASDDELPPTKRLRMSSSRPSSRTSSQARRDTLRTKLRSQLLPHIIRAVGELPAAELKLDAIAIQAATILVKDPEFRSTLGDDSGLLTPVAEISTAQRAAEVVRQLSLLPQYRLTTQDGPVVIKEEQVASQVIDAVPTVPTSPLVPSVSEVTPVPELPNRTNRPLRKPYQPRIRRETSPRLAPQWTQLTSRPYLSAIDRDAIQQGSKLAFAKARSLRDGPAIYHVDFSAAEIAKMVDEMNPYVQMAIPRTTAALRQLCIEYPVSSLMDGRLPGRMEQDVRNFCSDLMADRAAEGKSAKILSLRREPTPQHKEHRRETTVSSLLFARELEGNAGMGRTRRYVNFQSTFKQTHEDAMSLAAEFTNCAGDISTMTWVPHQNILCGTTAHSDAHNQQYNKPGNLLLCSISRGMLRAFPDHRIPRPLVTKGENSSVAMRQSQDPWIYSSVVSSDYDKIHGLAYTSSFDKTIKAWKVDRDGGSMQAVATFQHTGNVNFVVVAKDGSGRVAAAADTKTEVIRIYTMDPNNIAESSYYTISCSRNDADDSDTWAYCPATVQWGIAPGTQHLLLIGYSPRSFSGDEQDIPNDKQQTGEIMLWDAHRRCRVQVMTATTANVFEVAWHPTVCGFVVGTSPVGLHVDHGVRTQVHVFRQDMAQHREGEYSEFQKLDCFASDINELTIVSNSMQSAYVTAACTDGKVYVWDVSQGDKPIHVLKHGSPLEEVLRPEDREREDTGVKFTTWGSDLSRLYTGSSDGVVKVWNIRNRRKPFVRDLLRAPGPISCGSFSPDHSKLAIGDATGRLFLFSVTKDEKLEEQFTMVLPGTNRRIRRPKPFTPHAEPPPPAPAHDPDALALTDAAAADEDEDVDAATFARRKYLDTQQVTLHHNPVIGAVQGSQYAASGLFLRDAHLDDDPAAPLVTKYERLQQESRHSVLGGAASHRRRSMRRLAPAAVDDATEQLHRNNVALDFDATTLAETDLEELVRAGALLDIGDEGEDWGFTYEDSPMADDDDEEEESLAWNAETEF
ncbi:hypothetical protein LMH87_009597 [Akanthomyces muscarius]|uniref:Rik1-associated factor 1 n=1 Tax=Akanthomyces muscarius TaxID=2231603 RepID=A0A9W8QCB4_AKAMU|nr:hypothetical protein LMH87_009597 [Akanthomyces muscarius]KAJ4153092.1 hypothetical protein LMH87_009597 [Akanthomyces muscarius]